MHYGWNWVREDSRTQYRAHFWLLLVYFIGMQDKLVCQRGTYSYARPPYPVLNDYIIVLLCSTLMYLNTTIIISISAMILTCSKFHFDWSKELCKPVVFNMPLAWPRHLRLACITNHKFTGVCLLCMCVHFVLTVELSHNWSNILLLWQSSQHGYRQFYFFEQCGSKHATCRHTE